MSLRQTIHTWNHPDNLAGTHGWDADASALITWAQWTVESLYYLNDLDAAVEVKDPDGSHGWQVIDLAHARWAASSAVGAVDLCAAALARQLGIGPRHTRRGEREFDLFELHEAATKGLATGNAAAWVHRISADPDVEVLTAIRHPTTHARLRRHLYVGAGPGRTHLILNDKQPPIAVATIVALARDTATTVVEDFLDQIANGQL